MSLLNQRHLLKLNNPSINLGIKSSNLFTPNLGLLLGEGKPTLHTLGYYIMTLRIWAETHHRIV